MDALTITFWFSAAFVVYAYFGYPALIWLLSRFKRVKTGKSADPLPAVSLIVSAYNEEAVIEEKLINSLALSYPRHLLDIVVVSDGSDDRTNAIVERYASHGVRLKYFEGRIGKTACLNQVVPACSGEIIVFSDANSMFGKDALTSLAAHFADPKIGFTTGYTRYSDGRHGGTESSIGFYAALEKFTKKAESRIGSCVGADGAIFAIRRLLYKPLRETDINDFVIPLSIVRQGFRGVLEEGAFCVEKAAGERDEFRRQVRITNRSLRALFNNLDLFNPLAYGMFAFELFSHKAAKFLAPFFIILLFADCALALARSGAFSLFLIAALGALGLFAAERRSDRRHSLLRRLASLGSMFLTTNAAVLAGWLHFVRGKTFTTWSPVKR
jgi:cellulose synthase/poly-beta-1,6-N-acetylglucosamine synthase-like glycosyltransferase